MKKVLTVFLSLLLIFALTACGVNIKISDSNISDSLQDASTKGTFAEESSPDNADENPSFVSTQPNDTNDDVADQPTESNEATEPNKNDVDKTTQTKPAESDKDRADQTTQTKPTESNKDESSNVAITENTTLPDLDNGVLENVTSKKMRVPENMELLGTDSVEKMHNAVNINATVALYQLDGDVVNWTTEQDLLYVITESNSRLVVIDTQTMLPLSNIPLAGKPGEINLIGDEIYISLPDLCRIDIFSKTDYSKKSSLIFEEEVSSFCLDGDTIYYSTHSQHCDVFKKDLTTNESTKICPTGGWSFYYPKLYLNKEDNLLYIGETKCSGCSLYYYDATTLEQKSVFQKNDYGMWNLTREIFHIGDKIFWGNYCFSDLDAGQIISRYGDFNQGSVNYASEEVVSTFEGLFLTDTCECIINYSDADFKFEYVIVSESEQFFFRSESKDKNIIIGVNFDLQ